MSTSQLILEHRLEKQHFSMKNLISKTKQPHNWTNPRAGAVSISCYCCLSKMMLGLIIGRQNASSMYTCFCDSPSQTHRAVILDIIYIYMCVYVCVCVYRRFRLLNQEYEPSHQNMQSLFCPPIKYFLLGYLTKSTSAIAQDAAVAV